MRLLPQDPERADLGLRDVIENARAAGAPEPPWIAVDEADRRWISMVAACPSPERSRGVVLAVDDAALLTAHRLGVGGAAMLPVSTPALTEALESAFRGSGLAVSIDPGFVELFKDVTVTGVVAFANRAFWKAQLGDRALTRLLAELAIGLRVPPAVLSWPALLVADRSEDRIREAWGLLAAGAGRPVDDLVVSEVSPGDRGVVTAVFSDLLERTDPIRDVSAIRTEPVHELPSGRLLGWWAPQPGPRRSDGWTAAPIDIRGILCRWRVDAGESEGFVGDVCRVADLDGLQGAMAARVPGALTGHLRPGTPAGLLVQRLAEASARRGLPLWVPNVDTDALRFALRLPGTVWVDGPAVPR